MIESWDHLGRTPRGEYAVFSVHELQRQSPHSGKAHTFYVIDSADWVNIIPVTPDGQLVFVRQYRHGTEEVTLEIPGGMVDPGETPAEAGRREMREETGYDATDLVYLGAVAPNPAIQSNQCHTYLARGAVRVTAQDLEGTEDIAVTLIDPVEVPGLIVEGQITHALVVVAFYLFAQYQRAPEAFSAAAL